MPLALVRAIGWIAALGALTSCARAPEELCAEKFAALDSMRRMANADIIRQQGECRAVAAEFPGDKMLLDNCLDTLRAAVETAQLIAASESKRMAEPDMQKCATATANFFDQFDMARYEVTTPDGRLFEVTAPKGASQDDVLAYAQRYLAETGDARQP